MFNLFYFLLKHVIYVKTSDRAILQEKFFNESNVILLGEYLRYKGLKE